VAYASLGPRTAVAVPDATGNNPGNWTIAFTEAVIAVHVPVFEIYHVGLRDAPAGASAQLYLGAFFWGFTAPGAGGGAEWDPNQPLLMQPGQELYMYWDAPASGKPPSASIWMRYDITMWSRA
jgi:hypothetical protein